MRGRLIISRFALLTGLPPKTLRYYDEIGLLRPDAVDDQTGYRAYSAAQINLAVRIRHWRALGLPIDDIRTLIRQPELTPEVLHAHEQRLTAEIADRQQALTHLRHLLQETPMHYRLEQLPDRQCLIIRTVLQPPHYEVIPQALQDLMHYARRQGYQPAAPSFFIHHNDDTGQGSLVEVCVPVDGDVRPEGRIEVRTLGGGAAFIGRFVGPYDQTGAAYTQVVEEALRRGLSVCGVTAEFYVRSVPHTPNPQEYETDIAFYLTGDA
ncbi:MerR family transcriptional regulator [Deinococcus radiotolerans]|uniref:MerR family transcriptional regulator n=1 Tax=Deinococcus radiotolerans TaxID=1309407 RepID=A0ABQ2FKN8_9DEIO|nr:MerR family transcriptional regulator [Deinococcus radiotolerans]GGL07383.1 MerR family transcriptional regulator [Deinococcus radiotolerans]